MAIAPLQLPGPLNVPQLNFSSLDKIGDAYVQNQERQREAAALGGLVESIPTRGEASTSAQPPTTQTVMPGAPRSPTPSYPRIPGYEPSTAAAGPVGPTGPQLPRGLRNNNPGNIEDGPLAKSLPGYAGSDGRFAKFDTPDNGLNAMDALLTSYGRRGLKTVGDVVGRWAPASDNNDVGAYARFVSPNGDPNAPVDLSDPAQRKQIVGRMAMYENGMHGGPPGGNGAAANGVPAAPSQAEIATAARGMTPDMKKRVQALFAVGSPTATQAGLALISKFIGKQEPIKLAEGDVLVDPDSGQIIGRAPGKSQAVREGGALVQDGKLVYQAPDRPQSLAPGATQMQNGKPIYTAPANQQIHEMELPNGVKAQVIFDPQAGKMRLATPEEIGAAQQSSELPPEVNPRTVREKRSQDFVANEQAATQNAKAAADFKPLMDQAVSSYERATKAGGVGPIAGSAVNRAGAKYITGPIFGSEAEKARQDYDTALAGIQARIVAAQNKGEGQVSNFERALYASQFPNLQRLDPEDQIKYLKQLQAHTNQTIETGGKSMLGKQPSIVTERPAIGSGKTEQSAAAGNPKAVIDAARAAIAGGKDRGAVIQHLQQLKIPIPPDF